MPTPRKGTPSKPEGRTEGTPNPRSLEAIEKKRGRIYAALLAKAIAGDAMAGWVCLQLIGDLPRPEIINGEAAMLVVSGGKE